jgi:hypothetical protein
MTLTAGNGSLDAVTLHRLPLPGEA